MIPEHIQERISEIQSLWVQGYTYSEISEILGIGISSISRMSSEEKYLAGLERARNYKQRNKEKVAAKDKEYRQSIKTPCPRCDAPMTPDRFMCRECNHELAEERAQKIAKMYNAGIPIKNIAAELNSTPNSIGTKLDILRKQGLVGRRYDRR